MKTRIALLFTASVVTINTGSLADADLAGLLVATSVKPVSGATETMPVVEIAQAVTVSQISPARVDLPVEVGSAAIAALPVVEATAAVVAAEPVEAATEAPAVIADLGAEPLSAVLMPVETKI